MPNIYISCCHTGRMFLIKWTYHMCVSVCEQVPSSEEAVTPSSAMTPSASGASSRPFIPVTDDPGAASIIAETMTKTKEVSLSNWARVDAVKPRLYSPNSFMSIFRTLRARVKWSVQNLSTSMSSPACLCLMTHVLWWTCSNWQCLVALGRKARRCCLLCCPAWEQLIRRWVTVFCCFYDSM